MKLRPVVMKLSDTTINLLKNFKEINQSILFKQGNKLRTMSVMKNILAEATVDQEFPKDFGIYDLQQFMNGLRLYQSPELDFSHDSYVVIREGKSNTKYFFADAAIIASPPDKPITLPSEDVSFVLTSQHLDRLKKSSSLLQLPDISAIGEDGVVRLVVRDKKNDTSNKFSIEVGETDKVFTCNFKEENLKLIEGSYDVAISSKLLSRFQSKNYDLTYYIALEPDSTFE